MIVGTPDPKCINCKPDMPYHWHDATVHVDVYAPQRERQVAGVTVGGETLTSKEALELARQLQAAAKIAEEINAPIMDTLRADYAARNA
jgi:hypothetical protein